MKEEINFWTKNSIELANQRDYLDQLYKIYPVATNLKREIEKDKIEELERYFTLRDNKRLLSFLLKQEIFPIKDSYVAYLKRDPQAVMRNPCTCERLCGQLYELGLDGIIDNLSIPKEANRQMGPLFKNLLKKGVLGAEITKNPDYFIKSNKNLIFLDNDQAMGDFAVKHLGYKHAKGLDFLAKFNNIFIYGEAKFLTDFGGHQNAQFEDATATLLSGHKTGKFNVMPVAILDGVLYINNKSKMHNSLLHLSKNHTILSALFLRDFLYAL